MLGPGRYILYCRRCGDVRVHEIQAPGHRKHALAATLTLGLWLPGWLLAVVRGHRPRCRACGRKRSLPRSGGRGAGAVHRRPGGRRHLDPAA